MIKIIGTVYNITTKTVDITKLNYEEFMSGVPPYDRTPEENIDFFYGPRMSLKYSNDVIDDLIKYAGKRYCEIEIEKGLVTSIKFFKSENEVLLEYEKHTELDVDITTGKPKSLQDKLRVILNVLVEMERETGIVKISDLTDRLASGFDIDRLESERLLGLLRRDGIVYETKEGYLKKT